MFTENVLKTNEIKLEDILKLKEQLITHYCFVHDEELKKEIESAGIPQIEVKVSQSIEKGKIILIDKNILNL